MSKPIKSLSTISKKELQTICGFTFDEAKAMHKYRTKVPVITDAEIHEASVDARTLHEQLGVKTQFSIWIDRKIKDNKFTKGLDYEPLIKIDYSPQKGGSPKVDYLLTVDAAKVLGLQEKNEIGAVIRRYFLLCEKALKSLYMYNPSRILTVKNKDRLNEVYNTHFNKMAPEIFFSITNAVVSKTSTGVKPYRWKQAGLPTPANYLEGKDLSFYLTVQDTYLRWLEKGKSLSEAQELIEELYEGEGEGIFDKYVNQ
ncbi:hypothetical protein G3R49_19360 [Shewanella sp. WXL01]|uniref:antA/AntB antirepressor family protein n=1 Tax=Shewanella sp. WXL01 TaxID=2709721 RepID=UPI001438303D|nr:antA/AntB antirepressor family protein [Shewanella sp. WXL01]NKF52718.1 hypothetical protein [Shewanella sp. WXL01]